MYSAKDKLTECIKVLITANMGLEVSIKANDTARMSTGPQNSGVIIYRMKVRGLITKMPGFYFSGYKNPIIKPTAVTSTKQIARLLHDLWEANPGAEDYWNSHVGFFNSTDGIPK